MTIVSWPCLHFISSGRTDAMCPGPFFNSQFRLPQTGHFHVTLANHESSCSPHENAASIGVSDIFFFLFYTRCKSQLFQRCGNRALSARRRKKLRFRRNITLLQLFDTFSGQFMVCERSSLTAVV